MPSLGKTKSSNTGFSKKESVKHKQSVVHFTFLFHIHYHLRETSSCVIAFHSNLSLGNIQILFPSCDNIVQGRRGQVLKITCQIVHHFGGTGGMDRKSQFDALTSQQIFTLIIALLVELGRRFSFSVSRPHNSASESFWLHINPEIGGSPDFGNNPLSSYSCQFCCANQGCSEWCSRAEPGHCHHRCRVHCRL